jgi:hypothetical protein
MLLVVQSSSNPNTIGNQYMNLIPFCSHLSEHERPTQICHKFDLVWDIGRKFSKFALSI